MYYTGSDRYQASGQITIRAAYPGDERDLARLAQLDSARPLSGRRLVAVVDGEIRAALSLEDRRTIAHPFERTAALVEMLRLSAFGKERRRARRRRRRSSAPQPPGTLRPADAFGPTAGYPLRVG